jgi:hypothetical protein
MISERIELTWELERAACAAGTENEKMRATSSKPPSIFAEIFFIRLNVN